FQNAALLLHDGSFALKHDRHTERELLVHSNALQIDVQKQAFDWLILPVDTHCLAPLAIQSQIENGVVTGSRVKNPRNLAWIKAHRERALPRAVNHPGNFS